VEPDTKTLNFVLHNLTRGNNKYSFVMVTKIFERLKECGYHPERDSYTLHYILDACGGYATTESEIALKKCLSTFREIREKNLVGPNTYGILSKVVSQLLTKGPVADKVAGSLLALCCQDGWFTSEVRSRFRSIMSDSAWSVQYQKKLSPDGEEPIEWKSNVHDEDSPE